MAAMARMRCGIPAMELAGGDVLLHAERYATCLDGGVLIAVSRSGSTSEILLAVEKLKSLGCRFKLVSLTCVQNSKLSALSDMSLEMPWAFDKSVCQTRTVSCLYFAFAYCLAIQLKDQALLDDLRWIAANGLSYAHDIEATAKDIAALPWTHAVVLGDAEICGLCEEGALAFKEICQLPSNYYHLLDSRHGPMVLFNEKTLILAVLSDCSDYELDFIRDVVKKGSTAVVWTDNTPVQIDGVKSISAGRPLSHIARGLPFIMLCQLITYFKSFHSGANPDAPDGLDAWISL